MGKIVIATAVFPPEPVVSASLSYDIANRLHQSGKDVVVLSPRPSRPLNYAFTQKRQDLPYEHVVVDSYVCPESKLFGRFVESYSFGRALSRYVAANHQQIDVIYGNVWPLFSQLLLARAAKKYKIPYYIHIQDIYPDSYCNKMPGFLGKVMYRLLLPIDKYVLRNATKVIGISPSMIKNLSATRNIDNDRFVLVRNWQNDKRYIDEHRPLGDKKPVCHLMYLGSINPTANVTLILQALALTDKSWFHLSIIGNGPDKENCQKLAQKLGIDVNFDSVDPDQVAARQGEADVLVLCLKKGVAMTATPSKLTAYMLSGRPVIASVDAGSDCANIIGESGCGMVVDPDDAKALANAFVSLAGKDSGQLADMGQTAFDYACRHLSRDKNLKIITDLLTND